MIRRIIDDPTTGSPLEISHQTYRPDAATAEMVRERDRTCTFLTCNAPSAHSQLDHTDPHPHGRSGPAKPGDLHQTSVAGLGAPCDREHRLKTFGGWTVARLRNRWEWTSPLGKIYLSAGPVYTPRRLDELLLADQLETQHVAQEQIEAQAQADRLAREKATRANEPPPF